MTLKERYSNILLKYYTSHVLNNLTN